MHRIFLFSITAAALHGTLLAAPKPLFESKTVHKDTVDIKADLKGAKELYLVVSDSDDGFMADWADWIEPTLIKADGSRVKLTELKPKRQEVGWGKLGVNANANGDPMKVGGKPVAFGFGAHAPSVVGFDLPAGVVGFEAKGGVDSGGTNQGSGSTVKFFVFSEAPGAAVTKPSTGGGGAVAGIESRYGLENARKNMTTFTTAPGLKASLFAAEPMIQNPTNIDIDPKGRVWAVECVNYRRYGKIRAEGDRVVVLTDTNGDGEADKDTTFFQSPEFTNPLGICVLPSPTGKGTQVIASAAPNVWLLTDKDGDDKCDDQKILFKTTGVWDYDHQIHAFQFGPDGKFYFNFGDAATSLTWPDGTTVKDLAGNEITNKGTPYRKGMVFRCDIDLESGKVTNVETLGWNFRNNYEVTVDSFGALWQSDNDDDGNKGVRINYVMEFGNYGYTDEKTGAGWSAKRTNLEGDIPHRHWYQNDPGVVPNLLFTGAGSPTGITVNEGKGLGAAFENQIIHCDAGPRTTRAYPVEKDGAGYKATMVDVLTSTDSWYRVSDLAVAPDGALFIADWYDPGVGGHAMGDHEPGKIMGRVYRVALPNLAKAPAVDLSTAEGAAKALTSPNRATQYEAWKTLHAMGSKAEPALAALWKSENPRLRARALGLLTQIKGSETKYLAAGLSDPDENLRIWSLRLWPTLERTRGVDMTALEHNEALMTKLFKDAPGVRRQIAIALRGASQEMELLVELAKQHDGKDRWYLEALGIGAGGNEDTFFNAWLAAVGDKWNTPAGRDIVWRMRAAKAAGLLAKLLEDSATPAAEKPRYLRSFDFLPQGEARTQALVELATSGKAADDIAREALMRLKGSKEASVAKALDGALEKAKGTAQFVELVRDFGASGQGAALLDTAIKLGADPAANDAVKLVLADPSGDKLLGTALTGPNAASVVNLLSNSGSGRAAGRLTALLNDSQQKAELRKAAVQGLARTQAGAEALVKLAKDGKFPEDLKLTAASALRSVQYVKLEQDIAAHFPMPGAQGGKPLPPVADLAKLKGDIAKGRAVFERAETTCVLCHKAGNAGVDVGPALSEIGTKLPKEAIYESILNPNAGVSMGFETQQFTLKDGGAAAGIVRSETAEEITIALPGGATQKLAKNNVAKREKLTTSLMPVGLNAMLSQEDLVNLVEYLASLKKP
jgi:putative membrane-bound dehydrogenase-like protein